MTSIAANSKQILPWLQAFFAPKAQAASRPLWNEGTAYQHAITALSAKVVSVDGAATPSEIAAFGALFPVASTQYAKTRGLFEKQMQDQSPVLQYARQLRLLGTDMQQRQALLAQLVQLANCDAPLNVAELEMLRSIAKIWGMDAQSFGALIARVLKSKSSSPYEVLGVSKRAADQVIRTRYMEQVRALHPDQFSASGASDEVVAIFGDRMSDVNAAYHAIARQRKGLKKVQPSKCRETELTKGARI